VTTKRATGPLSSMDVTQMGASVWADLMGHPDTPALHGDRGYWRPSKLGRCMAHQFLWRAGVPPSRIESEKDRIKKEMKFDIGNRLEDQTRDRIWYAGLLIARGWTMQDADLQVRGNIDLIWGGELPLRTPQERRWPEQLRIAVAELRHQIQDGIDARGAVPTTHTEVKSTISWAIDKMRDEPTRLDYRCQAGSYRLLSDLHPDQLPTGPIDRHEVLVVPQDSADPRDRLLIEITEADADLARERLEELNERWRTQDKPPCTCGQTPGLMWEATLCDHLGLDGSVCCGHEDQLERVLQASLDATAKPALTTQPELLPGRTT
jgi:hypothetical protein